MLWANSATGFDVRIVVTRMMFLRKTPVNHCLSILCNFLVIS